MALNLSLARSLLFLPADRMDRLEKAAAVQTGGIVLDLEDGVSPEAKARARQNLASAISTLRARGRGVVVRINESTSGFEDIDAVSMSWPDAVMVPKALPQRLLDVQAQLKSKGAPAELAMIALVETPLGVVNAAAAAAVCRPGDAFAFGGEDYATSAGIGTTTEELSFAAHMVALAARSRDLCAFGVIGSIAEIRNLEAFYSYCLAARKAGYSGALTIHPVQVAQGERAFTPSADEVSWAQAVMEDVSGVDSGATKGRDGRMIDRPMIERARRILARA